MTIAHPSVTSYEPRRTGRTPVRSSKAVTAVPHHARARFVALSPARRLASPGAPPLSWSPVRRPAARPVPAAPTRSEAERHERAQRRAAWVYFAFGMAIRLALIAAILALAVWVVASGLIPDATGLLADWYAATIAPYAAMDFTSGFGAVSPAVELGLLPGAPPLLQPAG